MDTCNRWSTGRLATCNVTSITNYIYTRDICESHQPCTRTSFSGVRYGVTWPTDYNTDTCVAQLMDQYNTNYAYSLTLGASIPCCASAISCVSTATAASTSLTLDNRPVVPTPYDHLAHLHTIADHTAIRWAFAGIALGLLLGFIPLSFILATRCHSLICDDALPPLPPTVISFTTPPMPVRHARVLTAAPNRASMMYPGHMSNGSTGSNPMTSSSPPGSRRVTIDYGLVVTNGSSNGVNGHHVRQHSRQHSRSGSGSSTPPLSKSPDGTESWSAGRARSNSSNSNGSSESGRSRRPPRGRHHSQHSLGEFDFTMVEMEPRFHDDPSGPTLEGDELPPPSPVL